MTQARQAALKLRESGGGATAPDGEDSAATKPALAIVLTGTDPENIKGGIGTAVAGYRHALTACDAFGALVPTFRAGSLLGKWWPWLRAFPVLWREVRRLKQAGNKVVVYGHAGPRISLLRESAILLWARLCGARSMLQIHTPHMDRYLDSQAVRLLLRLAFMPVDQVTVLSPWWRDRMRSGGFTHCEVIPNPLSQALEPVARTLLEQDNQPAGEQQQELLVLAMARLTRGKGIHVAVEAMAHLPSHVRLRVAGDGPELPHLKAQAAELGVAARVEFLGWIDGAEKIRQLQAADLFCAPSTADAFSMSMIEALTYGLPVVASRSRAIGDLVQHGETGFLVTPNDAQATAQAIGQLTDDRQRRTMGRAAKAWVLQELSGETVGRRIIATAERLFTRA